ncbi:MAG: RING finger domain-containing protein [Candidatus Thorarchaeota archaeon]
MSKKFCPKCNTMVLTKRDDIDVCLLIILGIFTGGIGALIYLLIYLNHDPNRCIKCNSICTYYPYNTSKKPDIEVNDTMHNQAGKTKQGEEISRLIKGSINFCPNCGSKILNSRYENPNYCPFCGEKLIEKYQKSRTRIQCTICHIHINNNDETIQCSYCGSKYHYSCVAEWLSKYNSCPMCQNQFLVPKIRVLNK